MTLDEIGNWCAQHLGSLPQAYLFSSGKLSEVFGLRLEDGREIVLKSRPETPRIQGCTEVQAHLWARGFPCPQLLAGPSRLGDAIVTAESFVPGGDQPGDGADCASLFAEQLALLVKLGPDPDAIAPLKPVLPWVGWAHEAPELWPPPDDMSGVDLNSYDEPAWVDDVARRIRQRLNTTDLRRVVGHGDWESQNLRWNNGTIHVVHDWDSVICEPEAAIAGAAAAVFAAKGVPGQASTVEQSQAFLEAYQRSRAKTWLVEESQIAWCAGLWVRAFNAKKEWVAAQITLSQRLASVERLSAEVDERLSRAAV